MDNEIKKSKDKVKASKEKLGMAVSSETDPTAAIIAPVAAGAQPLNPIPAPEE